MAMGAVVRLLVCVGALVGAAPASSFAQGTRYAVIVQGASGDPQYASLHRGWVDALASTLRNTAKLDPARIFVLAEQPKPGEQRGSAENVRAVLAKVAADAKADDLVFVMLIGHGSGDGAAAKFNLVGPDLTAEEWSAALKPLAARTVVVDSTSSSFPFLAGLSAPNRIVITATNSFAQRFHTVFPDAFIRALTAPEADADKNGRISIFEAFAHASRLVAQHYEQNGTMATERAVIDDTGDGKGREAQTAGADGDIAALTYLDVVSVPTVADPEIQQLLVRQQTLTEQVDDLRRRRSSMAEAEFERQFEALIVELSLVSRDVRRRSGVKK
jgi:hypothetical protein